MTYSVHEAKTQLSRLLDLVQEGEEIVILRHGRPVAQFVLSRQHRKPVLGSMRGEIQFRPDWNEPMEESAAVALSFLRLGIVRS